MPGNTTAEGVIVPAPGDGFDYLGEQRRMANSQRSVVSVASRAAAEVIATAMNTDGRPVNDGNPLVVWRTDLRALEVKGSSGWTTSATRAAVYKGTGLLVPASTMWGLGGSLAEDVTAGSGSVNNDFVTTSGETHTFLRPGTYSLQALVIGTAPPPTGWVGFRKGDDSIIHSETGIAVASSWAFTHTAQVITRTANEQVRLRINLTANWNIASSLTTIVKVQ